MKLKLLFTLTVGAGVFLGLINFKDVIKKILAQDSSSSITITLRADHDIKDINPLIFGSNAGWAWQDNLLWDKVNQRVVPEVKSVLEQLQIAAIRFGGHDANLFHWYQAIGPVNNRPPQRSYLFSVHPYFPNYLGVDEFMQYIDDINGQDAIIAVNVPVYFFPDCQIGTAKEAAKWVEYMNAAVPVNSVGWSIDDYKGVYRRAVLAEYVDKSQSSVKVQANHNLTAECGKNVVKIDDEWVTIRSITDNGDGTHTLEIKRGIPYITSETHEAGAEIGWWDYSTVEQMPVGYFAWLRSQYGRYQPYQINYWELGNENLDWNPRNEGTPDEEIFNNYVQNVRTYIQEMKAVDPAIKVGAVGRLISWGFDEERGKDPYKWEKDLLARVGTEIDFIILHLYAPGIDPTGVSLTDEEFYHVAGAVPKLYERRIELTKQHIADSVPGKDIEILITEWNLQYGIEPEGYSQHHIGDLKTALNLADVFRVFIEQDIEAATLFTTRGWYWSMIEFPTPNWKPDYTKIYKRAGYFVFDLFRNHFGDVLLDSEVFGTPIFDSPICDKRQPPLPFNNCGSVPVMKNNPYLISMASRSKDMNKLFLLIINKHPLDDLEASINIDNITFTPASTIDVFTLNASSFDSYNTADSPDELQIVETNIGFIGELSYTFPAHSITVLEINKSEEQQINLSHGLNQIAWPAQGNNYIASSFLAAIDSQCGQGTGVLIGQKRDGFWQGYVSNYGGEDFALGEGEKYIVEVNRECHWRP